MKKPLFASISLPNPIPHPHPAEQFQTSSRSHPHKMGTASKVLSMVFRVGEIICGAIVAGILGQYLHVLDDANVDANNRIVYAISIAGISIFFALLLTPPVKYSFWAFGLDFALFVCWMVAFGLLVNVSSPMVYPSPMHLDMISYSNQQSQLTGSKGCSSTWYWRSWGYYWDGWWVNVPINSATQTLVGTAACSYWRTGNAFSFIGGWCWFANGLIVSLHTLLIDC